MSSTAACSSILAPPARGDSRCLAVSAFWTFRRKEFAPHFKAWKTLVKICRTEYGCRLEVCRHAESHPIPEGHRGSPGDGGGGARRRHCGGGNSSGAARKSR